jgi:hypothetical protein
MHTATKLHFVYRRDVVIKWLKVKCPDFRRDDFPLSPPKLRHYTASFMKRATKLEVLPSDRLVKFVYKNLASARTYLKRN